MLVSAVNVCCSNGEMHTSQTTDLLWDAHLLCPHSGSKKTGLCFPLCCDECLIHLHRASLHWFDSVYEHNQKIANDARAQLEAHRKQKKRGDNGDSIQQLEHHVKRAGMSVHGFLWARDSLSLS